VRKLLDAISILEIATAEQLRKQGMAGLNFLKEFWQMGKEHAKASRERHRYK
jgi:hypothetical protein